jgi:hypothetical protein
LYKLSSRFVVSAALSFCASRSRTASGGELLAGLVPLRARYFMLAGAIDSGGELLAGLVPHHPATIA